jgi:predicted metalloendopeptidase
MLDSPRLLVSAVSLSIACACTEESAGPKSVPTPVKTEPVKAEPAAKKAEFAATVKAAMDPSADPCTDFYQYACGGWIRDTQLPADQSRWVRSFSVLRERNREILRDILEDAARTAKGDDERGKLGRYYAACMDEQAIERAGAEPLAPLFAEIARVKDVGSFMTMAGKLQAQGLGVLFGLYVGPDDKNPKMNIAHLTQGGLGMPDRDYYLEDKNKEIREAYEKHVATMFGLLGEPEKEAAAIARDVLALETALAKGHMTRVERRDPDRTYHKIDRAGIEQQVPELKWALFAEATGHPEIEHINVKQLDFLKTAAGLLASCCRRSSSTSTSRSTARSCAGRRSSRRAGSAARRRPTRR